MSQIQQMNAHDAGRACFQARKKWRSATRVGCLSALLAAVLLFGPRAAAQSVSGSATYQPGPVGAIPPSSSVPGAGETPNAPPQIGVDPSPAMDDSPIPRSTATYATSSDPVPVERSPRRGPLQEIASSGGPRPMAGSRSPEVTHGPPRSVDAPPNPAPTTNLSAGVPGTTSGESPDWLEPLPPYEGPYAGLDQKTPAGKGPVSPVSFEPFLADEKDQERPLFDWERVEDEDEAFDWSLLDPINFGTEMKEWVGLGPNQEKAREHMEKGRELMLQEKFGSAADQFGHAASRWPDSVLEEDALFFQGECYFFSDRYTKAMECYHGLIKKYQGTQHMDTATRRLFAIGRYWEMHADQGASFVNVADKTRPTFDIFGKAKKAYEAIYLNDPLGPLADDSVMAIANAYFRRGKTRGDSDFSEAAFYYEYLRKNYPNSEHVIKAAKREIQSRHLKYSGPEYDATPLEETQELAERTMYQFGSELGEDRRDLVELRNRNQEDLAKRLWTLAQYYEKKRYYGSARIIYQKLMKKYPSTSFFQRAKERYREIEDRPAEPNRFDWLTDLF